MTKPAPSVDIHESEIGLSVLSAHLPDAQTMARDLVNKAIHSCVDRMGRDKTQMSPKEVQGDDTAMAFFRYYLAQQTAHYIGSLDGNVKSIYVYDDEMSSDGSNVVNSGVSAFQVHMVAWVSRKTDALQSLAAALDSALADACANVFDCFPTKHILDLQIADDNDVRRRVGYGALLTSVHYGPLKIWQR